MIQQLKEHKSEDIKWLVALGSSALVMLIPETQVLTMQIKGFLAITVFGVEVCAFNLVSNVMIGICLPLLYMLFDIAPGPVVFEGWTGTLPMVTFGTLLLAVLLEECGLLKRIALFAISKSGGTYKGICFALCFAGLLCSLMTSCCVQYIFAPLAYGVCKTLNMKPSKQSAGIMFAAAMGTITANGIIPYPGFIGVLTAGASTPDDPITLGWLETLKYTWPGVLFLLFYLWFMLTFLIKEPQLNAKETFDQQYRDLGPISKNEKKAIVIMAAVLISLLLSQFTGMDTAWPFMLSPWVFFLPGIRIGNESTLKKMNYGMVFLIVAFISIGSVSNYVGLADIVSNVILEHFSSNSVLLVVLLTILLGVLMNFLLTPLGYFSALSGVVGSLFRANGLSVICGLLIFQYTSDMVVLPYENMAYLVYYSFGMISMKDFAGLYAPKMILMPVFICTVMLGYWNLIGLI